MTQEFVDTKSILKKHMKNNSLFSIQELITNTNIIDSEKIMDSLVIMGEAFIFIEEDTGTIFYSKSNQKHKGFI